jgi:hypothetical protein
MKDLKKLLLFEQYTLSENESISPSTKPGTMSLWHGGNLDDPKETLIHKKGRHEYGPGLYLTTYYDTAAKYAKGGRKMYMITIEKGTELDDVSLDVKKVKKFIDDHVIGNKKKTVLESINKHMKDDKVKAYILNNTIINNEALKPSNTQYLREFFVSEGIDYCKVFNAFGWGEMMIVLFNMKKIVDKVVVKPKDNIDVYDLPTEFN